MKGNQSINAFTLQLWKPMEYLKKNITYFCLNMCVKLKTLIKTDTWFLMPKACICGQVQLASWDPHIYVIMCNSFSTCFQQNSSVFETKQNTQTSSQITLPLSHAHIIKSFLSNLTTLLLPVDKYRTESLHTCTCHYFCFPPDSFWTLGLFLTYISLCMGSH